MTRLAALVVVAGVAGVLAACKTDVPDPGQGLFVSGDIGYGGTGHSAFARPGIVVALFAEFPPMGPPRGIVTLEGRNLAGPLHYEMVGVPAGKYKVVAQVVDLTLPTPMTAPTGSFPNSCILFAPVNNIEVKADSATTGVNITIYESRMDPCARPTGDAGPPDGGAAVDAAEGDAPLVEPDAAPPDAGPDARLPDAMGADAAAADAAPADAKIDAVGADAGPDASPVDAGPDA